jgi:hypothetical protein
VPIGSNFCNQIFGDELLLLSKVTSLVTDHLERRCQISFRMGKREATYKCSWKKLRRVL